ncbi:MAG: branched-chain amino acid transport system permease protein [Actinomycetota bacterium]|nr:branched-chain amino acid transport system permease protein [Actinomycetota bacterium]
MGLLIQIVVSGIAAGAVYGLVGTGYALVYRLTGVVHFALGELVGLTIFCTLFFAAGTGTVTRTNLSPGRYAASLGGGLVVAVASGVVFYLVAVRPFLRRGSTIGWVGGAVAITFVVRGLLEAGFRRESYVFPDPFSFERFGDGGLIDLGHGASLPVRTFFVIGVALLLAVAAAAFLDRTRTGRGLRAIAEDPEAARLMGVPSDRLLAIAFALAGGVAGLAAVIAAPGAPVTVEAGALLGLKGLVAALFARFELPWKVLLAGLGVGVLEAAVASGHLGPLELGPAYRDVVPLAIALAALAFGRIAIGHEEVE